MLVVRYDHKVSQRLGRQPERKRLEMRGFCVLGFKPISRFARAAELADMSRLEFLANLDKYGVGPFEHMGEEDIHRDASNA